MKLCGVFSFAIVALFAALIVGVSPRAAWCAAADNNSDDLVGTIATLLGDQDKDIRALGLQQVREAAKGTKATEQFAALLPKLPPDAQVGLLDALADRGDKAARPAVLELLKSRDKSIHDAAMRALGSLGEAADVPSMVRELNGRTGPGQVAVRASLMHLPGRAVDAAIADELKGAKPEIRAELIQFLGARARSAPFQACSSQPKIPTTGCAGQQ